MKQKQILFFLVFFFLGGASLAHAEGSKFHLGVGMGVGKVDLAFCDDGDCGSSVNDSTPYVGGHVALTYDISPRVSFRFLAEASASLDDDAALIPNVEAAGQFFFIKEPKVFNPYVFTGIGFINVWNFGVGSDFHITPRISLYTEGVFGTFLFLVNNFEARAGVKFNF